jgi:hypothetical protein
MSRNEGSKNEGSKNKRTKLQEHLGKENKRESSGASLICASGVRVSGWAALC